MYIALTLFMLTYILMLVFGRYRTYIALGSALIFIVTGMLPIQNVFSTIDFNVLLMIVGTMGLVSLFIESRMPDLLADLLMEKVPNVQMAAVVMSLFAGIISAVVDNVATVLMVAPVALQICKKLKTNPVPFLIAIAVSSNLQGAATLVGDTTSIMLGSALDMSFFDFLWYNGRPGMFFVVQIGALFSALIVAFIFRKEKQPVVKTTTKTIVYNYVPTILMISTIVLLITASFIDNKPAITNGLICCGLLVVGLLYNLHREKQVQVIINPLKNIDVETLGLLVGLFVIIGGITEQGVIDAAANLLATLGKGNVFVLYTIIVWASVLLSAFIDNIPYVATMIPVIAGLSSALGVDPTVLYFGLLSGATLGGNCTPIGASANITAIGILRKEGYIVKNKDFFKIGIPFTLAAIIPAYIILWLLYGI